MSEILRKNSHTQLSWEKTFGCNLFMLLPKFVKNKNLFVVKKLPNIVVHRKSSY